MSGSKEHTTDLDREPLLRSGEASGADAELGSVHPRHHATKAPVRRLRYCRMLRWPLLLAIGGLLFFCGLSIKTGTVNPVAHITTGPSASERDQAVRTRVLKTLLAERFPPTYLQKAREENWDSLERLATCLEANSCTDAEKKVVILASYHFGFAEDGATGGEDVWARSTIKAFRELNYTIIFAWHHMEALLVHQYIPELVHVVLFEESTYEYCQQRNASNHEALDALEELPASWQKDEYGCLQSEAFPQGIPHWKAFVFLFWPNLKSPLGGQWTVSPEDYSSIEQQDQNLQYLGYSIEERCNQYPTFEEREHRALVLAKNARYFNEGDNKFYGVLAEVRDSIKPARNGGEEVPFDLFVTAGEAGDWLPEPDLETHGILDQDEWTETLARSKVLLGIGSPILSPSPYYGLCLGVPFINPILFWDHDNPNDRSKWVAQHNALRFIDEPYVYNVKEGDKDGLRRAIQRAIANPIERYIPPDKKFSEVVERARRLVETDWQTKAKAYVEENYGDASEYAYLTLDSPAPFTSGGERKFMVRE